MLKKIIFSTLPVFLMISSGQVNVYGFNIARPDWLIGDNWTYRVDKHTIPKAVLGVKKVKGFEAYELQDGTTRLSYYTKDLSHIQLTDKDGKILYFNDPPMKWFDWPLSPNKKWSQSVYWEDRRSKDSNTILHWSKVESKSAERVKVPAGEFEAVKVTREAGAWRYEYWYSPEVKNYIRWITHRGDGSTSVSELFDYKIGGVVEYFLIKEPVVWPLQPKAGEYLWIIFKFFSPTDLVRLECEMTYEESGQLVTRQAALDLTKTEQKFEGKTSGTILYRWKFTFPGKRNFRIWIVDKEGKQSNIITLPIEIQG